MGLLGPPIFGIGGCEGKFLTCADRYLGNAAARLDGQLQLIRKVLILIKELD